jgi:6-phosphogluconolactonase (cycloisomerase 2 family)
MRATTRIGTALIGALAALAGLSGTASAFGAGPHHSRQSTHHTDFYPGHGPGPIHRPSPGPGPIHGPGPGPGPIPGPQRAVFVQTDNTSGNQIVSYERGFNGTLTQADVFNTGGLGGVLSGSEVDHLASQGSLAYDPANNLLYAVNAGSNTISVFAVYGDQLALRQVLSSGGTFPVSIAVSNGLVYVLNAEEGGSVDGFALQFGHLVPIPGSNRTLGLNPAATPQFTNTPGQVAFSPNGQQLIVTTKANGSDIDVFGVSGYGYLSTTPVVNSESGAVPFAVSFDQQGHLIVAEAAGFLASFALNTNGTVTQIDSVATEQTATCWVAANGSYFFASNAGSASFSAFQAGPGGALTALGDTSTDAGTVDAAVSSDTRFLYVQTGAAGIVDEFALSSSGPSRIGSVTVPGAIGGEGIVAQ